ncbi:hypothetical protein VTN77DRAFT_568 [Rasamsonia byssochlamydoides]|uniref:uncharacterized protein n=1 Tax=Rasamsonia byssochlamydoides TaxID=89139 RepID=UPI003743CA02
MPSSQLITLASLLFSSWIVVPVNAFCKAVPGSPDWPSPSEWQALNASLSGRLLQPPPPGAVCHPDQPTFNNATCAYVQQEWSNTTFHVDNPISTILNNWNNDSCLPYPADPCSGEGYPIYVVNATTAEHVKLGVDFARQHNIRLIVKGTGHDYLGRSVAPNSLSIWTHHIRGFEYHASSFHPQGCSYAINSSAVTVGAGMEMEDIYRLAGEQGMALVGGGGQDVGIGGYLTGGGHGALSTFYGLAADQVLEVEIVTASGEILTANECQNSDLFWAVRGGGGSTFGVMTSATFTIYPDKPISSYEVYIASTANSDAWWDVMAYFMSEVPRLSDSGMMGYTYIYPNTTICGQPFNCSILLGDFLMLDASPGAPAALFAPIINKIQSTWPTEVVFSGNETQYENFYSWWFPHRDSGLYGDDMLIGSRLLDGESLAKPVDEVKQMLQDAIPPNGGANVNMVAGKNVWHAKPRGGGDAVNPAWRKAYLHFVVGVTWPPLDETEKQEQEHLLRTQYVEALRQFNPDSGCYINEADPYEPNWQQAFWGSNYPRLLSIKKKYDPDDVFWCQPCVGNEGWRQIGRDLCRVE